MHRSRTIPAIPRPGNTAWPAHVLQVSVVWQDMVDLKCSTSILHTLLVKASAKKFANAAGRANLLQFLDVTMERVKEDGARLPKYILDWVLEMRNQKDSK